MDEDKYLMSGCIPLLSRFKYISIFFSPDLPPVPVYKPFSNCPLPFQMSISKPSPGTRPLLFYSISTPCSFSSCSSVYPFSFCSPFPFPAALPSVFNPGAHISHIAPPRVCWPFLFFSFHPSALAAVLHSQTPSDRKRVTDPKGHPDFPLNLHPPLPGAAESRITPGIAHKWLFRDFLSVNKEVKEK